MNAHAYIDGAARGSSRFAKKKFYQDIRPKINRIISLFADMEKKREMLDNLDDEQDIQDAQTDLAGLADKIKFLQDESLALVPGLRKHSNVPIENFDGFHWLVKPVVF